MSHQKTDSAAESVRNRDHKNGSEEDSNGRNMELPLAEIEEDSGR